MRPETFPACPPRQWRAPARITLLAATALALAGCTPGTTPATPATPGAPSSAATSGGAAAPASSPVPTASPVEVSAQTVVDGLDSPWAVAFLPDGGALVTERDPARVQLVRDGRTTEVGRIEAARPAGEGGLLGIALSPDFATDRRVFLYYTAETDNRVESFRYADGRLTDGRVILSGITKNTTHNGGRLAFGPDGYLYIGTGDAQNRSAPQDRAALNGKILRITADGRPAPGNPFGDTAVYSYGHRNVQGLVWDPAGRLWATEFGPTVDDEVNLIRPGGDYGWPEVTGAPHRSEFIDAVVVWPSTAESSPSGAAILGDSLWIGALRGQRLWQVPLAGERAGEPVAYLDGEHGRLRDVERAPDGSLWVLTDQGQDSAILRVTVG